MFVLKKKYKEMQSEKDHWKEMYERETRKVAYWKAKSSGVEPVVFGLKEDIEYIVKK